MILNSRSRQDLSVSGHCLNWLEAHVVLVHLHGGRRTRNSDEIVCLLSTQEIYTFLL